MNEESTIAGCRIAASNAIDNLAREAGVVIEESHKARAIARMEKRWRAGEAHDFVFTRELPAKVRAPKRRC